MLEPALFGHDGVPGDMLHLALDGVAVEVSEFHAFRGDDGEIAIGEKEEVARVIQDGGDVGGDKIFVLAQTDDRGRTVAGGDNLVGLVDGDDAEREYAGQ